MKIDFTLPKCPVCGGGCEAFDPDCDKCGRQFHEKCGLVKLARTRFGEVERVCRCCLAPQAA